MSYDVQIHPGRAVITNSGAPFEVELHFDWKRSQAQITKAVCRGDIPRSLNLRPYREALEHEIAKRPIARTLKTPKYRPHPGRSPNADFYRQLQGLHNRFLLEGRYDPAAAIGELMDVPSVTVRTWMHRGRRYLEG